MKKHQLIRLRHHEIDKKRWDAGIASSTHPLIYADSWYLDLVAPQWEAVVSDDYSILWPLTINRKHLWPMLVQPMFTQQLGIFSSQPLDKQMVTQIYKKNPYPILTLQSHAQTKWPAARQVTSKQNAVLPLQKDYDSLQKAFRKGRKHSVKKVLKDPGIYLSHASTEAFITFTQKHNNYNLAERHLQLLQALITGALARHNGFILSAESEDKGPLAMAFFLRKYQRIIHLSGHSSTGGLAKDGMSLIINQVIKDYAGSDYLLDFEGSDLKGVASFYRSFGADVECYQSYRHPWFKNWQRIRKGLGQIMGDF
ncbi:hypothetical protein [Geofilum rhodophaeum]|uniref:hypothetical protein n=1 Tax=Geofilum rhodophaeum TaxID=1965019 RepID=UPI000B51EC31|nr:hypothetical protein [Geofilum rhodophaeum]